MAQYYVTDIEYDIDGEDVCDLELPDSLEITIPEDVTNQDDIEEYIADTISNITGFCHYGFSMSLIK